MKDFPIRIAVFLYLLLFSHFALGHQERTYRLSDHKHRVQFVTYQAKNMTRRSLGRTALAMRHCKMVDRLSFIKNEHLAYDRNIAGAFYCPRQGELQAYVIVKKF